MYDENTALDHRYGKVFYFLTNNRSNSPPQKKTANLSRMESRMAPSPQRAREAVFGKAADALEVDTAELAERWAKAFERRAEDRGEPSPIQGLEAEVESLVAGIVEVLK